MYTREGQDAVVAYYSVGFLEELVDVVDVVAACRRASLALLEELIEGRCEVGHLQNLPSTYRARSRSMLATGSSMAAAM